MTPVATFEEQCAAHGVKPDVYDKAWDKLVAGSSQFGSIDAVPFSEYPNILSDEELVAVIRMDELDKRNPQVFNRDGYIGPVRAIA